MESDFISCIPITSAQTKAMPFTVKPVMDWSLLPPLGEERIRSTVPPGEKPACGSAAAAKNFAEWDGRPWGIVFDRFERFRTQQHH